MPEPRRPVIGVACRLDQGRLNIPPEYIEPLARLGALPLAVHPVPDVAPEEILEHLADLDGVMLIGGTDIDPSFYGEEHIPECLPTTPARDAFELALTRWAIEAERPLLGICRGHQVVNVLRGATLYQDLGVQCDPAANEVHRPVVTEDGGLIDRRHEVEILPGNRLSELLGAGRHLVNSRHHQGIRSVGRGLRITARSGDGLIEGTELPDHPFCLTVQWHPEMIWEEFDAQRRLFQAFVDACRR